MSKLWGGRFEKPTHKEVDVFGESLSLDGRLWQSDLLGSIAHVRALAQAKVISDVESETLITGLTSLRDDLASGALKPQAGAEDIHSEIERLLTEKLGTVAGKVHTGRSRNDQVSTAMRLHLRGEIDRLSEELIGLQAWITTTAAEHKETVLPGVTHFQHAQPVSLAHHLLAYFWMFQRDRERLQDLRKRVNLLPLGSAALAGTPFPMDREAMAKELGFDGLCENSLDAVSDRDYVVEFLSAASLLAVHLSRISEELIIWSSPEFGFVKLDDSVTTGSSIMPQKKNPDVAELIRGRTGRATGALVGALTVLKGLPLSYNRDLQEDKFHLYAGLDNALACVRLMRLMLENASFQKKEMEAACTGDFSTATDLADFLVRKGLPFRQAHEVAGKAVLLCLEKNIGLEDLAVADLTKLHSLLDAAVLAELTPLASMKARISRGGTSPSSVTLQLEKALAALEK